MISQTLDPYTSLSYLINAVEALLFETFISPTKTNSAAGSELYTSQQSDAEKASGKIMMPVNIGRTPQ